MDSEFRFLKHLKDRFKLEKAGDDCAVIPKDSSHDYLVTSDMLVENIDFRLAWTMPEFVGHKALAVSISDIAAMGGSPVYSMVSAGVPDHLWESGFLEGFYKGYMALAARYGIELVGGDISRTPDLVTIDSTVIGKVSKDKAILRAGAKAGDIIFVTGNLGAAAAGLKLLERGLRLGELETVTDTSALYSSPDSLIRRQLAPCPVDGTRFADLATSMIDISDGLSSDLMHVCRASATGAKVFAAKIPLTETDPSFNIPNDSLLELALHGGEDYELLFTVDPKTASGCDIKGATEIGEITADTGSIELVINGHSTTLDPKGYSHF